MLTQSWSLNINYMNLLADIMEKTPDSMLEKRKNAGFLTLLPVYMLNLILPQLNRKVPTSPNEKRNQAFRNTIWIPQSIQQLLSLRVTAELMDMGQTVLRLSRGMGATIWPWKDNFTLRNISNCTTEMSRSIGLAGEVKGNFIGSRTQASYLHRTALLMYLSNYYIINWFAIS